MIIASLYSKPVNISIAFHYGQKNNGYSAFIPNTRYLVYQPRLTDAIIVIFGLLSYEHPCNARELFICRPLLICAVRINYRLKEAGENFDPHFIIIITVSFSA